jgi:hypothetical protein
MAKANNRGGTDNTIARTNNRGGTDNTMAKQIIEDGQTIQCKNK